MIKKSMDNRASITGQSWSVAHLQHVFRLHVITNQVEHNVKTKMSKSRKAA